MNCDVYIPHAKAWGFDIGALLNEARSGIVGLLQDTVPASHKPRRGCCDRWRRSVCAGLPLDTLPVPADSFAVGNGGNRVPRSHESPLA